MLSQQLANGLAIGCVYALMGIAYTLVFGVLRLVNFAQGEFAMVGAFVTIGTTGALLTTGPGGAHPSLALAAGATAGITVSWLVGVLTERIALSPLRRSPALYGLLSSLGVSIFLQNAVMIFWTSQNIVFPSIVPTSRHMILGASVTLVQLCAIGLTLSLAVGVAVARRSRLGIAIAAAATDRELASVLGINVDRVTRQAFAIAAILAGIAGIVLAAYFGVAKYDMGFQSGIKGFSAAVLGGIGNPLGAVVGGLTIGIVESLGAGYISSAYRDVFAFAVLILVLAIRPAGIFREPEAEEKVPSAGTMPSWQHRLDVWVSWARGTAERIVRCMPSWFRLHSKTVTLVASAILLLLLPRILGGYGTHLGVLVLVYIMLGLGLNVVLGLAGLLDLGYIAFYAIGAYAYAVIGTRYGWSLWECLPLCVAVALISGVLIGYPSLRVRGIYLAIVTLGFGEIVRLLLRNWDGLTNGPKGIAGIPRPAIMGLAVAEPAHFYYLALMMTVGVLVVARLLDRGRAGRYWRATSDNERAAECAGVNTTLWRLLAFAFGAAVAGMAGAFFAAWQGFVAPESFTFSESVLVVCIVVLAGARGPSSIIAAALVLVLLPEVLRGLVAYRMLVFGASLVPIVLLRRNSPLRRPTPVTSPLPASADSAQLVRMLTGMELRRCGLSCRSLQKCFGGVRALVDVSLDVEPGRVLALIGPNGAGKTTLINALTGVIRPEGGQVLLGPDRIDRWPTHRRALAGLSRVSQVPALFRSIGIEGNVRLAADRAARRQRGRAAPGLWLEALGLRVRGQLSDGLSGFEVRLVELARALAAGPSALLLDEPAAGLTPQEKAHLAAVIRAAKDAGVAVLLVEHDMSFVEALADDVVVLDQGRRIFPPLTKPQGTFQEAREDKAVRAAYLGEEWASGMPRKVSSCDGGATVVRPLRGASQDEAGAEPR